MHFKICIKTDIRKYFGGCSIRWRSNLNAENYHQIKVTTLKPVLVGFKGFQIIEIETEMLELFANKIILPMLILPLLYLNLEEILATSLIFSGFTNPSVCFMSFKREFSKTIAHMLKASRHIFLMGRVPSGARYASICRVSRISYSTEHDMTYNVQSPLVSCHLPSCPLQGRKYCFNESCTIRHLDPSIRIIRYGDTVIRLDTSWFLKFAQARVSVSDTIETIRPVFYSSMEEKKKKKKTAIFCFEGCGKKIVKMDISRCN